ncbi:MAG: threonine synthase [Candidatus Acetothermia bacterium]|nr:threonine synthase [Candidatus Acetothermia bacterium]
MTGQLYCPRCGFTVQPTPVPAPCPRCRVPLTYRRDLPRDLKRGDLVGRGVWRYAPFLPPVEPVTLGEGGTPLVPSLRIGPNLGITLWFKLEGGNPSGSFKDRGAAVLVAVLRSFGIRAVADDSSGNAGSALAAYAARAGLQAQLFVPAYASEKKLAQIRAYGAGLALVPGPRERAADAVRAACAADPGLAYASHNESPYFLEGLATLAYELFEGLDGEVPDHVVAPVGGGGLFLGLGYGFARLRALGWLARAPRVHAAQAEACAPIARAAAQGLEEPAPAGSKDTVAEGIRIPRPPRGREVLGLLRALGGAAVTVPEEEILATRAELAEREGIYVEPTSAVAVAALRALVARGAIRPGEEVVVPLTGSGLKAGSDAATG